MLARGEVLLFDYVDTASSLAARGQASWMRTYRAHQRGIDPLVAPGEQDITCDVPLEYLRRVTERVGLPIAEYVPQREWMGRHGIAELVAEGDRIWQEGAARGDLAAIAGRSRGVEAAALTDPGGLGAHRVLVLRRDQRASRPPIACTCPTGEPEEPTPMSDAIESLLQEGRTFPPPAGFVAAARVRDRSVFAEAEADPEAFWAAQAEELVNWFEPWHTVCEWDLPVREVVRGRLAERVVQLPRPPRRGGRGRQGRVPLGGRARATPARSPTPSSSTT